MKTTRLILIAAASLSLLLCLAQIPGITSTVTTYRHAFAHMPANMAEGDQVRAIMNSNEAKTISWYTAQMGFCLMIVLLMVLAFYRLKDAK